MEASNARDDFLQELSARLALHEVLLTKLFAHQLQGNPNAREQWEAVGAEIVRVMGSLHQPQALAALEDWQAHWMQSQRRMSQEMATRFVQKVARYLE